MIVVGRGKNMCDIPAGCRAGGLEQKVRNEREAGESTREIKKLVLTKDFKVKGRSLTYMPKQQKGPLKDFKVESEMTKFSLQNGNWKLERLEQLGDDSYNLKVPWNGVLTVAKEVDTFQGFLKKMPC